MPIFSAYLILSKNKVKLRFSSVLMFARRKLLSFQLNDIVILALDLIAIPDFGAGAMENWGLITYRETSLLYSQDETSVQAKQWIGVVVAHELAHQWF